MAIAPEIARLSLADQPWFKEFLGDRGFERSAPGTFTNGRATVRVDGSILYAIPGDGTKSWRSEINVAPAEAIRQLLKVVLAAPAFLSQAELNHRVTRQRTADEALQNIATSIREHPETHSGQHLRRFVWSIWNGHHALNLWHMNDVLDSQHNARVSIPNNGAKDPRGVPRFRVAPGFPPTPPPDGQIQPIPLVSIGRHQT